MMRIRMALAAVAAMVLPLSSCTQVLGADQDYHAIDGGGGGGASSGSGGYDASTKGVVIDKGNQIWWQQPIDQDDVTGPKCQTGCSQPDAMKYCAAITLAGYSDWRLPERKELESLLVSSNVNNPPTIDQKFFPDTPTDLFWSSSLDSDLPGSAWFVNFDLATVFADDIGTPHRVRCVRSATM